MGRGNKTRVLRLSALDQRAELRCDVAIVGAGPAGLTVARALDGLGLDILVVESGGLTETAETEALNEVLTAPGLWTPAQADKRIAFHAWQTDHWRHDRQGFGVRCRGLGGSSMGWAGKSAPFDAIDYAFRPWVPHSGWPIGADAIAPFVTRAADDLNLTVDCYDDGLWRLIGQKPPQPSPMSERLRSVFWQFARSRNDAMDVIRLGADFMSHPPRDCRVLTNATVIEIDVNETATATRGVTVADAQGRRHKVEASHVVLAASAIENARLLLNSRSVQSSGLGNAHDLVGRYLTDHVDVRIAAFTGPVMKRMAKLFGFYRVRTASGISLHMHGLAPSPKVQEQEQILNCALYLRGDRVPDGPGDAARRLFSGKSTSWRQDGLASAMASAMAPALAARGFGRTVLQSGRLPKSVSNFVVDQLIALNPNFVAEDYETGGAPHRLTAVAFEAISEQVPDPGNRVTLSERRDRFGVPLPQLHWTIGELEHRTFARLASLLVEEFARARLETPKLEDWLTKSEPRNAPVIDMAHTAGTTRMSDDPRRGVVDRNGRIHGLEGLYVAGASVFPTSGHANPTLMIMAFAHRLGAHLRERIVRS